MKFYSLLKRSVICQTPARHCKQEAFEHSVITVSGRYCQRWDSESPHKPNAGHRPFNASHVENWCLPIKDSQPWCYTTDPKVRWEYCPPPHCAEDDIDFSKEDENDQLQVVLIRHKMLRIFNSSSWRVVFVKPI